ncbi:pyrroloquinoline quinone biosynthesis peptide chaperone PqqD [Marinobacterium jannaschii]|nr:pyrroloquinoline quinone biosynthesis peptide chaperone PqqD [Marinobacterium jannaschii]
MITEASLNSVPGISAMYRFQWEQAQNCYVLLYPEGMIKLNGPAGEILALIDGDRSIIEIVALLKEKFDGAEGIEGDVIEFMQDAENQNWISLQA